MLYSFSEMSSSCRPSTADLMCPCVFRRYLPILRGFPAKFIYDPWNAPESVQTAAKCIIGIHYPKPMVNHAEASRLNIERMKQIYQQLSRYRGLGKGSAAGPGHGHLPLTAGKNHPLKTGTTCPLRAGTIPLTIILSSNSCDKQPLTAGTTVF